ncbi:hypothetical protein ACLB2K_059766 [Fragaria x ananassa]
MVRVSEFLPFILAFLGDDSVKIVGLFCKNRRPRAAWPTIFEVVALLWYSRSPSTSGKFRCNSFQYLTSSQLISTHQCAMAISSSDNAYSADSRAPPTSTSLETIERLNRGACSSMACGAPNDAPKYNFM